MSNSLPALSMKQKDCKLRLILGDQLNLHHSWFRETDPGTIYLMMEVRSETGYVRHHIQKVLGFFAAMRNFAVELQQKGHCVVYLKLDDKENLQQIDLNCTAIIKKYQCTSFEYQLPDEYRVDEVLKSFTAQLKIPFKVYDTEHFYTSRSELGELFAGKKQFLMETFYRYMRKKHRILLAGDDQPLHGKWNFDSENRKKLPRSQKVTPPLVFHNDVSEIEKVLMEEHIDTMGSVDSRNFLWPVSRKQSLQLLDYFIQYCFPNFGTFQDAMDNNEWSLYHSRLSFSMNIKMIGPNEVVDAAISAYEKSNGVIAYHQLEGFVRQILGWREYMRGIYWLKMPGYASMNYFGHDQLLPKWFWDGNTKMNCLHKAITQSLDFAYAHHIQRLMITGNFALLAGVHPDEVDAWYLGIYIDALEWVEITNTRGMSQFADGGVVGTKPYVSAAAYIHKMSSYCESCFYNPKIRTGEGACPFNSLYWNFFNRHEKLLAGNNRVAMMYNIWNKMAPTARAELLEQADYFLDNIDEI